MERGETLCTRCQKREAEPGEDECPKCRYRKMQAQEKYRNR